jgi:hypothetical protein
MSYGHLPTPKWLTDDSTPAPLQPREDPTDEDRQIGLGDSVAILGLDRLVVILVAQRPHRNRPNVMLGPVPPAPTIVEGARVR